MTLFGARFETVDDGLDSSVAASKGDGKVEDDVTLRNEWGKDGEIVERSYDRLNPERSEEGCLRRGADEGGDVAW